MTTLPGTSEKESLRIGNEISKKIRDITGVKSVAQWVGRSPMGADTFGTHYSEFEIELKNSDGPTQDKILEQIEDLTQNNNYVGLNDDFRLLLFGSNQYFWHKS